jgi:aminoglycoside phosphotransferase family enzyme/predicted kinase
MPDAVQPEAPPAAVVETHTATLFFVGDRVYKLKKPVDLGFVDFSTREQRRAACHLEVDLNRRLAPDVYEGVADLTGPDGVLCDHLVVMHRMPEHLRLSRCVERGDDVADALRAIAHQVVTLHTSAPSDPAWHHVAEINGPDGLRQNWADGFDQLRPHLGDRVDREVGERSEALVHRYLDGRGPLIAGRIAAGRVREGHGDLQAEDVFCLPDGPRILDCLEFAPRYRWGDVLLDVAFLAMDLERLGRPDLATRFLAWYRELSADSWPDSLVHHDIAYRAHIRAKVGVLRSVQAGGRVPPAVTALFAQSLDHLERARVRLVVVGGLPGTGKSTVAAALGERLGAVVLRTDEARRNLPAGAPGTPGSGIDRYEPAAVHAVYAALLEEARELLGRGEHVVLDATWADPAERAAARAVAEATSADLTELCCVLAPEVAAARIRARSRAGTDPSEATPDVAAALAERFAPWPEATELDTAAPPGAPVDQAERLVGPTTR